MLELNRTYFNRDTGTPQGSCLIHRLTVRHGIYGHLRNVLTAVLTFVQVVFRRVN
jgi:hypothetical protein